MGYLLYFSVPRARVIDTINGFGFTMAECAPIELAIRATPKGSEGLGFSLMMSVRNLALFGSDIFGSWLLDGLRVLSAQHVQRQQRHERDGAVP